MSDDDCVETPLVERRLVKLSANQVVNSVETLLGAGFASAIREMESLPSPAERSFPPLAAEGAAITDIHFSFADRVGNLVGQRVRDEFDACGDAPTDECGRAYVLEFAEKAFRRPLRDAEGENLLTVYDECKVQGATVREAVRHGVWAVLDSPLFLYRTEFGEGDASADEVVLASYEVASELSYFLTDGPPDAVGRSARRAPHGRVAPG